MPGLGTALTKAGLQDMEEQGVKVRIVHNILFQSFFFLQIFTKLKLTILIQVVTTIATSHYSAKIFEKFDFEEVIRWLTSKDIYDIMVLQVRSMKYTDYLVDGEVVFPPKEPHTQAKLFIKAATSNSSRV